MPLELTMYYLSLKSFGRRKFVGVRSEKVVPILYQTFLGSFLMAFCIIAMMMVSGSRTPPLPLMLSTVLAVSFAMIVSGLTFTFLQTRNGAVGSLHKEPVVGEIRLELVLLAVTAMVLAGSMFDKMFQ